MSSEVPNLLILVLESVRRSEAFKTSYYYLFYKLNREALQVWTKSKSKPSELVICMPNNYK